jgi:hypothetical protein
MHPLSQHVVCILVVLAHYVCYNHRRPPSITSPYPDVPPAPLPPVVSSDMFTTVFALLHADWQRGDVPAEPICTDSGEDDSFLPGEQVLQPTALAHSSSLVCVALVCVPAIGFLVSQLPSVLVWDTAGHTVVRNINALLLVTLTYLSSVLCVLAACASGAHREACERAAVCVSMHAGAQCCLSTHSGVWGRVWMVGVLLTACAFLSVSSEGQLTGFDAESFCTTHLVAMLLVGITNPLVWSGASQLCSLV